MLPPLHHQPTGAFRYKFLKYSRNTILALGMSLVLVNSVSATTAMPAEDLTISGSGWGSGVGFSQFGARSMADHGDSVAEILQHYYQGAGLRDLNSLLAGSFVTMDSTPVWVGLAQDQFDIAFMVMGGSADVCFDLTDQCVSTPLLEDKWRFGPDGSGQCAFSRQTAEGDYFTVSPSGACSGSVRPKPTSTSTIVSVPLKGRVYRNGTLRFRANPESGKLQVALEIGIDDYVKGVQELPESWPAAALQAQAIVSRSLVVNRVQEHGPAEVFELSRLAWCACHIRDNDPDQAFGGYTAEKDHSVWRGLVEGTTGQVLAWNNRVIDARFTSSSGGRTEDSGNAGLQQEPYLVSVDDSMAHTVVAGNPFTTWTESVERDELASQYGLSWLVDAEVVDRNPSGTAATVRLAGIVDGYPVELLTTGHDLWSRMGVPSPFFDISISPHFADVAPDHAFAGEILGLADLGITQGCTTEKFCSDSDVTRAEMAAFLVRALNLVIQDDEDPFDDDHGSPFEAEIETIRRHGITIGCGPAAYCPDRSVTRGEMAAFLSRAFDFDSASDDVFTDLEGSPFRRDIEALREAGVTVGCGPATYCPERSVTRGEMAAFLIRSLSNR